MREAPQFVESKIQSALQRDYGLAINALAFLPIGNDAHSFVYQAITEDSQPYFVKLRTQQGFNEPSVQVPFFLAEHNIPHIITPLASATHRPWVDLGDYCLTVYPFIHAQTATDAGLSDAQWAALGQTLRQIHDIPLTPVIERMLPREAFIPWRRELLTQLEPLINQPNLVDPAQSALRTYWRENHKEIRILIDRCDALANELRQANLPLALCHADIHTWNVLVDADQHMWIVDWDEVRLAPKERDLMFVMQGITRGLVSDHQTACFLQGYGPTNIHPTALTYYRYAWAVQEMGAYAEDVFFAQSLSDAARQSSVDQFISVFAPGNIAEIALAS